MENIYELIGGKENVTKVENRGERTVFSLKDAGLVDLAAILEMEKVANAEVSRGRLFVSFVKQEKKEDIMAKDFSELATKIVELVGGKDNVSFLTHCITRLRFELKNKDAVKIDEIRALKGVIGSQWSGNQFQVIIGADVNDVYQAVINQTGLAVQESVDENLDAPKKKFSLNVFFETLSGCMAPILPALCAAGVVKGILTMLTTYAKMPTDSGIYLLLNAVGDVGFYFMPLLVAYTAAKKFKTNIVIAMLVAAVYIHPSITALAGQDLYILGIKFHILNYSSTIFPTLISVWILSYVYRWVDKYIPNALKFAFVPSITVLIMAPICLGIVGPIGYYIGQYLAGFVSSIFNINKYLGGFILGAIRPFVILTGMQTTFTPIILNNIATLGYDFILPVHCVFNMCCCGLCIGAFLRAKMSKEEKIREEKDTFLSASVSAFASVAEPTLYGCAFRWKSQLIALVLSSAICGAITGGLGGKCYGMANWLMPAGHGETVGLMMGIYAVSFVISCVIAYVCGFKEIKLGKKGN